MANVLDRTSYVADVALNVLVGVEKSLSTDARAQICVANTFDR